MVGMLLLVNKVKSAHPFQGFLIKSHNSVSMSLRHPAFVRWSIYIEECLDVLSSEPHALPSDAWLCELIRIQHIAEDASIVFSMDDPGSQITLRDVKTQYQVGGFRQQLGQWRRSAKPSLSQRELCPASSTCRR